MVRIDGRGRFRQRAGGALRLWEGDDVPDRFGADHEHDQPVKTHCDAAVRRTAELQGVKQMTEPIFFDIQRREHLLLHRVIVNPHRTTAQFDAVQYDIVRLCECVGGIIAHFGH